MRLDALLVSLGHVPTRAQAQAAVLEGRVTIGGVTARKSGQPVDADADITVAPGHGYVGRGGLKLAHALDTFGLDVAGRRALDVGASTGGFTDCMLKQGAEAVFSVDVGYGLLDWSLRGDPRVHVMERVNARSLTREQIGMLCDFASVDVSFISLRRIFPALVRCLCGGAQAVALVKPQFEAERGQVGKGGIVREPAIRGEVIRRVRDYAREAGLEPLRVVPSPIRGADGNVEFLMLLQKQER